jgi:hypothetical protein
VAARPQVTPALTRPRRKRKRLMLVIAAALTTELALAVAMPHSWWHGAPSRLPFTHVKGLVPQRVTKPPKIVIHQARARQRHRRRRIMRDVAIGSGAALAARSAGQPPRHRQGSPSGHNGQPPSALHAEVLPGLAALDKGLDAYITGLSCPSASNCAIVGRYNRGGVMEGFVDSEVRGRWQTAEEITGIAALAPGRPTISTGQVSCPSARTCLTVGSFTVLEQGYVYSGFFQVTGHDGKWGPAQPIPSKTALFADGDPPVLSCSSIGNCTISVVGGPAPHMPGYLYVDSEINGKWDRPQQIPGQARQVIGADLTVTTISCSSPGNCAVAGTYQKPDGISYGGYVASETDGVWGAAKQILGAPAARDFAMTAISCASAGNCGLTGTGGAPGKPSEDVPFVDSEVNGTWGTAEPIPGVPLPNGMPMVLSCPAPGECIVGGSYSPGDSMGAFVASESDGTWGTAEPIPGTPGPQAHGTATLDALSCSAAGNCSAGGQFGTSDSDAQAYTVTQTGGTWHTARYVPGVKALTFPGHTSSVEYMSCPPAGPCGAAGYYAHGIFVLG